MAHPLRKRKYGGFEPLESTSHELRLPAQTAPDRHDPVSLTLETEKGSFGYAKRLAFLGAVSVVVLSIVTGTPLAGLAVLVGVIVIKKALWAFGNWILDNTI